MIHVYRHKYRIVYEAWVGWGCSCDGLYLNKFVSLGVGGGGGYLDLYYLVLSFFGSHIFD